MALVALRPMARPLAARAASTLAAPSAAARGFSLATSMAPHLHGLSAVTTSWLRMYSAADGSIEERVLKAVKRYAGLRMEELKNEADNTSAEKEKMLASLSSEITVATKWEDLGFDDLDKVEVLLEVEDEFNHVIPDDDADSIHSVQESIEYLEKNNL
eukprot:CAMPEP_0183393222 /NCGR_PEP_ID=MMETSP0370-20130417/7798_1 /TAXON_ID=268820 /ORGANISM="Peridinium aciculiferum, Strain PAER-2" /LENGTH=157 /DNA_ID=CAMNT_0025573395 /DNA_START=82 /DNA_END=555 /DNA_ORIENTATION=+